MFCRLLSQSFSYIQVLPSCFNISDIVYMFRRPFFQYFFLYTGSAILFYHCLNSIHVPPPLFSIFYPIHRFCHPILPSFKQYTCSAAPIFQSFFLYAGSAILFYHLLNSIHVPPPPFSIFFLIYRFCHLVLPSFKQYTCSTAPFFNLFFSYIQVLPSCFTIF